MKLATIRTGDGSRAVKVRDDGRYIDLGVSDVSALLSIPGWQQVASHAEAELPADLDESTFAAVVPRPGKIICVGLNYRAHIEEMGRGLPDYPTLFAKYPEALIGAADAIELPPEAGLVDWEAELAVVIGRSVRRAGEGQAAEAIAGFTVLNDVTVRDWQYRTQQWLQGKTWERTAPIGPVLVTPDELPGGVRPAVQLSAAVNGEVVQSVGTDGLLFDPVALVQYISVVLTLNPGDVIATGTPGGVGHGSKPPRYLQDGDVLSTAIDAIGVLENRLQRPSSQR